MAQLLLANPRKRRRAKKRTTARRRVSSVTARSVTKRYRRNPIRRGTMGNIGDTFSKGAIGGVGAVVVDAAMQRLPMIPTNLQTGIPGAITKGLVGIGIGMITSKIMKNKKLGTQLADGAVTVAMYNASKSMIGPALGLSGYDDDGLLGYGDGLLGDDMGYYNAAPVYDTPTGFEGEHDEMDGYYDI